MTDRHSSQQKTGQPHEHVDSSGFVYAVKHRLTSPSWLARFAGVSLNCIVVGFVGLLIFVLEIGGDLTLITRPLPMQIALVLPYFIGGLTFLTIVGALLAWRYRYWTLLARIHQTILALLGLMFCWQLSTLGLLTV